MIDNNLKIFLKKIKKTQRQVADETGANSKSLSNYINGKQKPGSEFLQKMQELYNLNIDWLLSGEGEMFRKKTSYSPEEENSAPRVNETSSKYTRLLETFIMAYSKLSENDKKIIDEHLGEVYFKSDGNKKEIMDE